MPTTSQFRFWYRKSKKTTLKNKEYIICMCGAATVADAAVAAAAASHIRIPKTCYNIFWKQTTFSLHSPFAPSNHAYTPKIYFSFHLPCTHTHTLFLHFALSRSLFLDLFYFVRFFIYYISRVVMSSLKCVSSKLKLR